VHELKLQDQVIYIDPPVEYAKYIWLQEFHKLIGSVCCLPRLEANRYETNIQETRRTGPWGTTKENNYFTVLKRVPQELIELCYQKVTAIFDRVEEYVQTWLNYQSLWVLDSKKIQDSLGDDIEKWQ
jgi:dynein heavy chain 1, cytosolic